MQQPHCSTSYFANNTKTKTIFSSLLIIGMSNFVQADGILPASAPDAALINQGRDLFFNETFNGNGRTCATCHLKQNNFTVNQHRKLTM